MKNVTARDLRGSTALRGMRALRMEADPLADVRALVADITKTQKDLTAQQNKAFEDFKAANDASLGERFKDVVTNEKVDKINIAMEEQGKTLDDLAKKMASLRVRGDNDKRAMSPEEREHAKQFDAFFRKGKDNGLREAEIKAKLSTESDPDGGYTVTPEIEQTIDRVLPSVSAMRNLATVRQIGTDLYKKLINQGGATSGWVGEQEDRPETDTPKLSAIDFPVMEIYAQPAATQKLLDDSTIDIGQWLADEVSIEFAEQEGIAFILGDGQKKPNGVLGYAKVADADYAWGKLGYVASGDANLLTADSIFDLEDALKTGYQSNARWLMNRKTRSSIRKLKNGNGDYIWQPGLQAGVPDTLDGKPITIDDNMPNVAAGTYPIAFGDFKRGYLIIDRIGIRVLRDPFTAKPHVLFYTTKRVGGGVQNFEAIKLLQVGA